MFSIILIANIINAIGAGLNLLAHGQIGIGEDKKKGYLIYIISCSLLIIGSAMLFSWPVVILNITWLIISIYGIMDKKILSNIPDKTFNLIVYIAVAIGLVSLLYGNNDLSALMTTVLYFFAYALLCNGSISKMKYLILCSVGYLLLIMHLIDANQYAVFVSETLGFVIGAIAITKILWKQKSSKQSSI